MFFDEARIVIDESLDPEENPAKEGRYRFTLAHEGGGHWRLHRHLFAKDPTQAALFGGSAAPSIVCRSSQAKERAEWQADFYASCLLMPRKLIFETWRERFGTTAPFIFEINKFNPTFAVRRSNWIIDWDALRATVPGEVARCMKLFEGITIADTRECLLAALRQLRDPDAAKNFEHNFRSLERLWEAVAPDPCLYPHRYQYNWLCGIYVAHRRRQRGSKDTYGEL
jgi:hypothetical protein